MVPSVFVAVLVIVLGMYYALVVRPEHDQQRQLRKRLKTAGRTNVARAALVKEIGRLSSVDFVVTFQRGTEWAASGAVTQKVPSNFPTANTVSYRADIAAMDPRFANGLDPLTSAPAR